MRLDSDITIGNTEVRGALMSLAGAVARGEDTSSAFDALVVAVYQQHASSGDPLQPPPAARQAIIDTLATHF